jgi:hypothetical protein
MTQSGRKKPWSRVEKAILITAAVAFIATAAGVIVTTESNLDPVVTIPKPTVPNPNGFDYLVVASQRLVQAWPMQGYVPMRLFSSPLNVRKSRKSLELFTVGMGRYLQGFGTNAKNYDLHDPKIMAAATGLLQQNQTAISTAEQGLQYVYLTPPSGPRVAPYFAPFRNLVSVLAFRANVDAARGDGNGAVTSALDAVRIGSQIPRGGVVVNALVGYDCEAIGRKPIWDNLNALGSDQCHRVASTLESIDASADSYADVLTEQKWAGEANLMQVLVTPNWKTQVLQATQNVTNTQDPWKGVRDSLYVSMLGKRRIVDDYIAHMNAAIVAARGPYGTQAEVTASDRITDGLFFLGDRFKSTFNQTEDRLLATTCALRAYQLDHGAYPATLGQLVPSYLSSVPLDPFATSSPLRYRLTGAKYVLYSIGPDMHDDGGTPVFDPTSSNADAQHWVQGDSHGDIVAGVNQ